MNANYSKRVNVPVGSECNTLSDFAYEGHQGWCQRVLESTVCEVTASTQ